MRLRVLAAVAALVLAPVAARAQTGGTSGGGGEGRMAETVHLNQGLVDAMIPLLQGESLGGKNLDTRLSARAMTRTLYSGNKNALFIARLDAADASRLRGVTGQALQVRQANATFYRANASKLDAVLGKLQPEPGCALCTASPASAARAR